MKCIGLHVVLPVKPMVLLLGATFRMVVLFYGIFYLSKGIMYDHRSTYREGSPPACGEGATFYTEKLTNLAPTL